MCCSLWGVLLGTCRNISCVSSACVFRTNSAISTAPKRRRNRCPICPRAISLVAAVPVGSEPAGCGTKEMTQLLSDLPACHLFGCACAPPACSGCTAARPARQCCPCGSSPSPSPAPPTPAIIRASPGFSATAMVGGRWCVADRLIGSAGGPPPSQAVVDYQGPKVCVLPAQQRAQQSTRSVANISSGWRQAGHLRCRSPQPPPNAGRPSPPTPLFAAAAVRRRRRAFRGVRDLGEGVREDGRGLRAARGVGRPDLKR